MRRGLILLIITLAVSPAVLARTNQDWGKVGRLKPGSKVLVILWTGDEIQGRLKSVSPTGLSLVTGSSWKPLQEIARDDIRRIVHLRGPKLPDPERWMRDGALIGGAAGVTTGAIQDATQGNNGRVLTKGLAGAGMGFFGSCVALAGVGVVATAHHSKVVYESAVSQHHRFANNASESDTQ